MTEHEALFIEVLVKFAENTTDDILHPASNVSLLQYPRDESSDFHNFLEFLHPNMPCCFLSFVTFLIPPGKKKSQFDEIASQQNV